MIAALRIHSFAGARRWLTAAVAGAVIAVGGIVLVAGDEPDAGSSPSSHPPTSEAAAPDCPKPRCWWIATPDVRPR